MIKLIVSDMDGTLVDSNHKINEEFWEVLEKLKERGIKFIVASGRRYDNLLDKFIEHKEDIIFIAENGALGMEKGKELFSDVLEKDKIAEFVKLGRTIPNAATILSGKKAGYMEKGNELAYKEASIGMNDLKLVDNLLDVEDEILKVAIFEKESSYDNLYPYYKKFEDTHTVVVSGKFWMDIMSKGVNKGSALEKIQNYLNIDKSETAVFGDYLNDLEMSKKAKKAFAMENGHDELKKIATHSAKSNDENGVVEAIKEYILKN